MSDPLDITPTTLGDAIIHAVATLFDVEIVNCDDGGQAAIIVWQAASAEQLEAVVHQWLKEHPETFSAV